jgi:hypothetical protein
MRGDFLLAEGVLASQEGLCSMELVCCGSRNCEFVVICNGIPFTCNLARFCPAIFGMKLLCLFSHDCIADGWGVTQTKRAFVFVAANVNPSYRLVVRNSAERPVFSHKSWSKMCD